MPQIASAPFDAVAALGPPPPLSLTALPPPATVGTSYSFQMAATGGVKPYTWSAASLPAGITLSASGLLSGTPTAAGTAVVTVTDSTPA